MAVVDLNALSPEQLRARRTMKWSTYPHDVLPLWVAEMDYPTAPPVVAGLRRAVDAESFGYPLSAETSGLADTLAEWLAVSHGWSVNPGGIFVVADVLTGLSLAIETFSEPTEAVIIPTPVYVPFFGVVELTGRPQVQVPMVMEDDRWVLDLVGIDRALTDGARTLILCNPQNPLGRVHSRTELLALAEVISRHDARVVSDEVHAPIAFGRPHIPLCEPVPADGEAHGHPDVGIQGMEHPGLKCAQVVTSNAADAEAWGQLPMWTTIGVSTMGIEANLAAYREGGPWLSEVRALLATHRDLVADAVAGMPGVRYAPGEGTYLAWLDCTELQLGVEPADWFLEHAKVALSAGAPFRAPALRFARLNFATTTPILEESLDRMARALESR